MPNNLKKKKNELVPGTTIECKSGVFIAFYEHRTDIIANGENEIDARKNLRKMYTAVIKQETEEETEKNAIKLPKSYKTKRFVEKLELT